jgi:hypothetical protein
VIALNCVDVTASQRASRVLATTRGLKLPVEPAGPKSTGAPIGAPVASSSIATSCAPAPCVTKSTVPERGAYATPVAS